MEIEVKNTKGKTETVRHWSNKDMKELHKANGYAWRSHRTKLRVLPITDEYRDNYADIFGHE